MSDQQALSAGNISEWLRCTRAALKDDSGAEVPCGECTACCRSSYFIHIQPHETATLSHIPDELLFPAPGLPKGNVLMGYDEQGHCPMLKNGACSIYEYRPATCRSYDCRIFPATGIVLTGKDRTLISQQAQRWKFSPSDSVDQQTQKALQKAGSFLRNKSKWFAPGELPGNSTQLAIMAIKVYDLFLDEGEQSIDDAKMAKAIIEVLKKFDAQRDPL
ncbi:MAG: YkgJ family cysteine cluster protein [Candidatus Marinimicrobia bacterium]|nr:YkgJ family cysteine cluster protein [Candidatus Neomarinimicrobiota bacterium]MCF7921660.1 YkgJ family cysteine cluster protein [Candidatus Neomarinimicrobiota bacterium]